MKTNLKQAIMALVMFVIFFVVYNKVSSQTLTIHPKVTLNGKSCLEIVKVVIIDMDTVDTGANKTLSIIKGFHYRLDDNKNYLVVFMVDGFQSKSIAISTNHTSRDRYLYGFIVNLSSQEPMADVYYAGGIYWNKKKKDKDKWDYYISSN